MMTRDNLIETLNSIIKELEDLNLKDSELMQDNLLIAVPRIFGKLEGKALRYNDNEMEELFRAIWNLSIGRDKAAE